MKHRKFKAETILRAGLTWAAVIGVPAVITLVALAKFSGLTDVTTLNHAQLARHITAGDGFATSALQPLALTLAAPTQVPLDLVTAPVHPTLLALVFRLTETSDKAVVMTGLSLWLLTIWLVFLIVRYWWSWRAASLAAVFCVCSLSGLLTAAAGLPHPLMALLVLGAVVAVFPKPTSANADEEPSLARWRPALAGVFCGAAALTDYRLAPLALVLGIFLLITRRHRALIMALFGGGLLLVLVPWGIRNLMASGRLFGLYWYGALENTRAFPGDTIWQLTNVPKHPLLHLLLSPVDVARKLALGLAQYQKAGLGLLMPVVVFLCGVALFSAPAKSSRRRLIWLTLSSAALTILVSCLTRPDGRLLLAWAPLLCGIAAAQAVNWIQANVGEFNMVKSKLRLNALILRSLTYTGIVALVVFPAAMQFVNTPASRPLAPAAIDAVINHRLPSNGVVFTDVPAFAAWYLNRPSLLLCQREVDLPSLEKQAGKIAGIYISRGLAELPQPEKADWWIWLASTRGVYRGLEFVSNNQLPGLLRLPQNMTTQMSVELEFDRLDALQKSMRLDPQSAEVQMQLAAANLKLGRLHAAYQMLKEVSRLDHDNVDALIGLWQAVAELNQPDGALWLAKLAAQQVNPRDPRAKQLIETAATYFERGLAQRPNDPWLLMNLITCQSQLKQWKEVETASTQLSQLVPKTFPARLLLGTLHLNQGELTKAAAECDQLVQEHPDLPSAHDLAGRVYLAQNKLEDALKEFNTTAQLRPQLIAAQVEAGRVCYWLRRYDDGVKHLTAALKQSPNSVTIKLNLADIYDAQGKTAEAIDLYREILAAATKQTDALNNLAGLLAKTGQTAEALTLASQAVALAPENPSYRDTAGWIAFQTGNQNEALVNLWEAVRLAPQIGLIQFHLGKVLFSQGQKAEARQAFKNALEAGGLPAAEQQEAKTASASS